MALVLTIYVEYRTVQNIHVPQLRAISKLWHPLVPCCPDNLREVLSYFWTRSLALLSSSILRVLHKAQMAPYAKK